MTIGEARRILSTILYKLIMYHSITNNINQSEIVNNDYITSQTTSSKDKNDEYWPIREIKMGIIPSTQLIHPLKYNQLRRIIDIKSITPHLSKVIEVYDYPLLVALSYDCLVLSQFTNVQCSDGRWAQGVMINGKYYSLSNKAYNPMSELKVDRGSVIQLRFNAQSEISQMKKHHLFKRMM
ncbi:unnamed protein product [Didymodactylos carnosus]|uniref:Uncharacterized protein n=1 Tax=Didymodactylos carnosus TaxID=1234261 RepID=A0A815Z7Y1_9BILA|nr:unnamed protein product [Didymodactylos carnosus]CAF4446620.1 unnamed protein product [Didymodactylos carnosus]